MLRMKTQLICVFGRESSSSLYLKLYTNIMTKSSWSSSCSNFRGLYPRQPTVKALIATYAWLWPYFPMMCPIYIKSLIIFFRRRDFSSKHHYLLGAMSDVYLSMMMIANIRSFSSSLILTPDVVLSPFS